MPRGSGNLSSPRPGRNASRPSRSSMRCASPWSRPQSGLRPSERIVMPLYLTEKNVESLIDVGATIEALQQAFAALAKVAAVNHPRRRYKLMDGRLNVMLAADGPSRRFVVKAYGTNGVSCHHVLLYSADHGLLAIIEAGQLGQIRTGAASGLATRHLARPE